MLSICRDRVMEIYCRHPRHTLLYALRLALQSFIPSQCTDDVSIVCEQPLFHPSSQLLVTTVCDQLLLHRQTVRPQQQVHVVRQRTSRSALPPLQLAFAVAVRLLQHARVAKRKLPCYFFDLYRCLTQDSSLHAQLRLWRTRSDA